MKKKIKVLIIEDNEYYSNLLSNAIQQSLNPLLIKGEFQVVLRTFTNAADYMIKIRSGHIDCDYTAVFIDYYLGGGINGDHVIRLLKEQSSDALVIMLSEDPAVNDKIDLIPYDYFVVKDRYAPALCGLYLQQYIENKYSVSLDT